MNYDLSAAIQRFIEEVILFIPNLVVAVIVLLVALYVASLASRAVKKAMEKRQRDPELIILFSRVTHWAIIIFGTIAALNQVNFDVTGFVAGLGIIGFTVGFALKDIAENFVAGILLLLQQPFDIGDEVEVNDFGGTVIDIEIRSTTVRTRDGLLVIIPNAAVYGNPITNFSKVDRRRINITVGVGYETDLQKAHDTLHQVITQLPGIKDDPAPVVVFNEFGDSSINATVYFWINTGETGYFDAIDGVVKGIKIAFENEGINIPFPIRTMYMQQQ